MKSKPDDQITLLLHTLNEGYNKKAWHGPNLRSALRGVNREKAGWRPSQERHSIRELVVHCAYWKYTARNRILGTSAKPFPYEGRNWF